jgi:hypothetical protein
MISKHNSAKMKVLRRAHQNALREGGVPSSDGLPDQKLPIGLFQKSISEPNLNLNE